MAKKFQVFFAPDDLQRLGRLKESLEIEGNVSIVRVCLERCMTRYPSPESITKVFSKRCARALADLATGTFSDGQSQVMELGGRYIGYIKEMAIPLGFRDGSKMIRGVLLMVERGDI